MAETRVMRSAGRRVNVIETECFRSLEGVTQMIGVKKNRCVEELG